MSPRASTTTATRDALRSLRALLAHGAPPPPELREAVAVAAREGEVVLLALEADPALSPWLEAPARRHLVIDGHLDMALGLTAEALARRPAGRVALLKGSASARLVYARTALRFRRDVDLLVENLAAARASLAAVGFRDNVRAEQLARGPAGLRTWPMALPTTFGQVEVDLHAAIVASPWCRPSTAAMLADAGPAPGGPLPTTSLLDTFVHTAIHLVDNGLAQPMKHWVDLDRLARRVDPVAAATRARAHGGRVAMWMGLVVIQRWFDTPVADHLAALGSPPDAPLLRALLTGDGAHPHARPLTRGPARHLARLLAADGIAARARYVAWAAKRRLGLASS